MISEPPAQYRWCLTLPQTPVMECTKWPLVEEGKKATKQAVRVLACHIIHISSARWPAFWTQSGTVIINVMWAVVITCDNVFREVYWRHFNTVFSYPCHTTTNRNVV